MTRRFPLLLAALLLAGCGDPAARCRKDVDEMKAKMVGVVGAAHKDSSDPMVQAHTHLDIAQTALATGNIDACLENVKAAQKLIAP